MHGSIQEHSKFSLDSSGLFVGFENCCLLESNGWHMTVKMDIVDAKSEKCDTCYRLKIALEAFTLLLLHSELLRQMRHLRF